MSIYWVVMVSGGRLTPSTTLDIRFFSNAEAGHNPPPAHRLVPVMVELMGEDAKRPRLDNKSTQPGAFCFPA